MNAARQYCTFVLNGMFFGVDVLKVQEVIRDQPMTPVPLASHAIRGLINLRGQIVTAIDLRRRLGLPDRPADRPPMNVVVRDAECALSLLVDEIGDVQAVDEAAFEAPPATLHGDAKRLIRGAYKVPSRLLLVLDIEQAANVSAL